MTEQNPILVLAGTREGRDCSACLHDNTPHPVVASLAGATTTPARYRVPVWTGGFGGWKGLARTLQDNSFACVVDATHPFAVQISRNARLACRHTGTPLVVLERPPWQPREGDNWQMVASLEDALAVLPSDAIVLAALGRKQLPTVHARDDLVSRNIRLVVRTIDPAPLAHRPGLVLVSGRPPHTVAEELDLIRRHAVTTLLCRNSGGQAGRTKLDAAADIGLPVCMIDRPPNADYSPDIPHYQCVDDVLGWIRDRMPETTAPDMAVHSAGRI